jgi:hypothetical protein
VETRRFFFFWLTIRDKTRSFPNAGTALGWSAMSSEKGKGITIHGFKFVRG